MPERAGRSQVRYDDALLAFDPIAGKPIHFFMVNRQMAWNEHLHQEGASSSYAARISSSSRVSALACGLPGIVRNASGAYCLRFRTRFTLLREVRNAADWPFAARNTRGLVEPYAS